MPLRGVGTAKSFSTARGDTGAGRWINGPSIVLHGEGHIRLRGIGDAIGVVGVDTVPSHRSGEMDMG